MVCVWLFAACDIGSGPTGKTPLDTPANLRVDAVDFTLRWSAVPGATAYAVDIDGAVETAADTEFSLKRLASDPKAYTLKVKALAGSDNAAHNDSAYSASLDCEAAIYIFTYEGGAAAQPNLRLARNIVQSNQEAEDGITITGLTVYGRALELINIPIKVGFARVIKIGSPASASVAQGGHQPFTATVLGANNPSQSVRWTVARSDGGTLSSGTYFDDQTSSIPTLYVATDEAVTTATGVPRLVVQANSIVNGTKYGIANVTVTAAGSDPGGGTGGTGSTQP
jgi:hypothetical protein